MFAALSFIVSAVVLPLIWHHRRQYDQRLHRSVELITQVLIEFREYQTQRNYSKFLAEQGSEVTVNLQQAWAKVTHSLHQFSLWTQPWFRVSAGELKRLQHQIAVTVAARDKTPLMLIDWTEAYAEAEFYSEITQIRRQLLNYSYIRYIRENL